MVMEDSGLPVSIQAVASELQYFIRSREDASRARRLITSHVKEHVNIPEHLPRPLSLLEAQNVHNFPHGTRNLYKDYVRALQANHAAKSAQTAVLDNLRNAPDVSKRAGSNATKSTFGNLLQAQRKHDRLHVNQDYLDKLNEKQAASEDIQAIKSTTLQASLPPAIPAVVLGRSAQENINGGNLQPLIDHLERAVLRARLQLQRERKLLVKIRSEKSHSLSNIDQDSKIRALGNTRNELITWIESELSQETVANGETIVPVPSLVPENIQGQLEISASLYQRYVSLRQDILSSSTELPDMSQHQPQALPLSLEDTQAIDSSTGQGYLTTTFLACLEAVAAVSNEQKAITQQKSHMSIALSKHAKTAGQCLDRQVEESHLLPGYLPPSASVKHHPVGHLKSFSEDLSGVERPDLSHRIQMWASASEAANHTLEDVVSENLEEGGSALLLAQGDLLELLELIGTEDGVREDVGAEGSDIWHGLHGRLGVI